MNRFVILLVFALTFFSFAGDVDAKKKTHKKSAPVARAEAKAANEDLAYAGEGPVQVNLAQIQGRKLGDLYASYVGLSGTMPASATLDFGKNLGAMWQSKLSRKKISPASLKAVQDVVDKFAASTTKINVRQYIAIADQEVMKVRAGLNWAPYCKIRRLDADRCKTLQDIAGNLRGKDMVAYGLTELMPTKEGMLNLAILDILLKNAGVEYIDTIPALHDKMLSFGLYQFTSYALYENGKEFRGASAVNWYVKPGVQIPGSVIRLRGAEHHRAAFMFSIENLALMIARLSPAEYATLARVHNSRQDEIVQYVATAHHLPSNAIIGARRWLANGAKLPYSASLAGLSRYAAKTQANLEAIYSLK